MYFAVVALVRGNVSYHYDELRIWWEAEDSDLLANLRGTTPKFRPAVVSQGWLTSLLHSLMNEIISIFLECQ